MSVKNITKSLLLFPSLPINEWDYSCELLQPFRNGKFLEVVEMFFKTIILQEDSTSFKEKSLAVQLETHIKNTVSEDAIIAGISCLYYYIQCNFLGPLENRHDENELFKCLLQAGNTDFVKKDNINWLCSDDDIIICTNELVFLFLAKLIFSSLPSTLVQQWWLLRCNYIHQLVLQDPSPVLHNKLFDIMKTLQDMVIKTTNNDLLLMFYLEKIQIHLQLYSEIGETKNIVEKVNALLHLTEVKLDGKLGKRTKYQERDIAQLTLSVNVGNENDFPQLKELADTVEQWLPTSLLLHNINYGCSKFPKDQRLDDDVRLPQIKFAEETETQLSLNVIQQAAILSSLMLMKKSEPKDEILAEKILAYSSYLLNNPQSWNIECTVLLLRSVVEAESSRTVERSIAQIQSLITDWEMAQPPILERLPLVFCSFIAPKRELETNLAKLLVRVGAIQSALDIYIHLQMWEEMVACYNHLKLRGKAAEVIRTEMAKQETVQLWCLLGDATDDLKCYEKAWEMSNEKSSRAQKHWALFYYHRKQYSECIPHFEKSLEINSLQILLWFNLGYAALIEENWELSAKAYRRYCSLEPDCFEAWNNLAKAYIKLGQKNRAWGALQEAVKCNYDNWKVWDNLMTVSTDCADFQEVIRCYHRILDIKGKHVDLEVLQILVNAVMKESLPCDFSQLKKEALKLLGRITSMVMFDSEVWKLYADLTECNKVELSNQEKIVQYLQKAYRIASQEPNWENSIERCKNLINLSLHLSNAQTICSTLLPPEQAYQHLHSAKLMLRGIYTKIQKTYTDVLGNFEERLATDVENLGKELSDIENKLKILNT